MASDTRLVLPLTRASLKMKGGEDGILCRQSAWFGQKSSMVAAMDEFGIPLVL